MRNIKTIFILVLSLILLFAVSCSNEGTTGGGTRTLSYYAGNWFGIFSEESGEVNIFTINADGSVIMRLGANETIPSTSITKNSDTSYTYHYHDAEINANMHFNFTSDTEGTITREAVVSGYREDYPVTKK